MSIKESVGIEKIKSTLKLIKDSLRELEGVEYVLELLERELEDYKSLVDKEALIPKARFMKERIQRLINRMRFSGEENLVCIGVKFSVIGDIDPTDKRSIINYITTYIDKHIRPSDLLFKLDDDVIGIIIPLKNQNDIETINQRLNFMLLNLKAKTYSNQNILINFDIRHRFIGKDTVLDDLFDQLIQEFKSSG